MSYKEGKGQLYAYNRYRPRYYTVMCVSFVINITQCGGDYDNGGRTSCVFVCFRGLLTCELVLFVVACQVLVFTEVRIQVAVGFHLEGDWCPYVQLEVFHVYADGWDAK